mmetsp:Transcript_44386/g.70271  ORF Transcript_44386/g.70271 Transcript_44386/m.70271 type:complete len:148 (+) Transcript_44386:644-1087(+)
MLQAHMMESQDRHTCLQQVAEAMYQQGQLVLKTTRAELWLESLQLVLSSRSLPSTISLQHLSDRTDKIIHRLDAFGPALLQIGAAACLQLLCKGLCHFSIFFPFLCHCCDLLRLPRQSGSFLMRACSWARKNVGSAWTCGWVEHTST